MNCELRISELTLSYATSVIPGPISLFFEETFFFATALPPDVRWRLCPTVSMFLIFSGAAPHAVRGIAPKSKSEPAGGA